MFAACVPVNHQNFEDTHGLLLFLLYNPCVNRGDYDSRQCATSFLDAGSIPAISTRDYKNTAARLIGGFHV